MFSKVKTGDYTLQICDSLWLNPSFFKEMEKKIADAPMKPKTYRYSDVGFILLRLWLRNLRECRWMPTCNVNFMNRWDWNVQDTFLCAAFRNRSCTFFCRSLLA